MANGQTLAARSALNRPCISSGETMRSRGRLMQAGAISRSQVCTTPKWSPQPCWTTGFWPVWRVREQDVLAMTQDLFRDPEFEAAATQATNTPARVRYRVTRMAVALADLAA